MTPGWRTLPGLVLDVGLGLICGYAALWGDDILMRALGVLGFGCVWWCLALPYERARIRARLDGATSIPELVRSIEEI